MCGSSPYVDPLSPIGHGNLPKKRSAKQAGCRHLTNESDQTQSATKAGSPQKSLGAEPDVAPDGLVVGLVGYMQEQID